MIANKVLFAVGLLFCVFIATAHNTQLPLATPSFNHHTQYTYFGEFINNMPRPPSATPTFLVSNRSLPEFLYADVEDILLSEDRITSLDSGYYICKLFNMIGFPQYTGFIFDTDDSSNGCVARSIAGLIHNFNRIKTGERLSRLEKHSKQHYSKYNKIIIKLINYARNVKLSQQNKI